MTAADARAFIAQTLAEHEAMDIDAAGEHARCECGWRGPMLEHREHVVEVVLAAVRPVIAAQARAAMARNTQATLPGVIRQAKADALREAAADRNWHGDRAHLPWDADDVVAWLRAHAYLTERGEIGGGDE